MTSFPSFLESIDALLFKGATDDAWNKICEASQIYPMSPELQFRAQKIALLRGNMTESISMFEELYMSSRTTPWFIAYMCEISQSIVHLKDKTIYDFYCKLPVWLQQKLLIDSAGYYESKGNTQNASKMYLFAIKAFPDITPSYGVKAAELLIQWEEIMGGFTPINPYRRLLVCDILPQLFRHKLWVGGDGDDGSKDIRMSCEQIEEWLGLALSYFLWQLDWHSAIKYPLSLLESCGLYPSNTCTSLPSLENPEYKDILYTKIAEARQGVETPHIKAFIKHFEFSAFTALFVYSAYNFYLCANGISSDGRAHPINTPTCLIPLYPLYPQSLRLRRSINEGDDSATSDSELSDERDGSPGLLVESDPSADPPSIPATTSVSNIMHITNLINEDLNEQQEEIPSAEMGISHLKMIIEILDAMSDGAKWASPASSPIGRLSIISNMKKNLKSIALRYDVSNAVSLTIAETCLLNGWLPDAKQNYQELFDQLASYFTSNTSATPSSGSSSSSHPPPTSKSIPPILPFRTIYCLALCYLVAGWHEQARLDLAILLASLPQSTPLMTKKHMEIDESRYEKAATDPRWVLRYSNSEGNMLGLAVRCVKHLVAGFQYELVQDRYCQTDMASLLVLIQFGWPYFKEHKVLAWALQMVTKKGVDLVVLHRYLYDPVLATILEQMSIPVSNELRRGDMDGRQKLIELCRELVQKKR
ncbi:uncharacterized protein VTP21DRAFT_10553 [Calcarisporiella thermophila]|uniref:uncharacterized protein n=1 Tax=Calcarisporiella thermophila TaxID=911321 RepID=UPI003744ABD0